MIETMIEQLKHERDTYREYFLAWQENGYLCNAVGVSTAEFQANNARVNLAEAACFALDGGDIVQRLRNRACPAGEPHTSDTPEHDHGHTDCWLYHTAADEIENLRQAIKSLVKSKKDEELYF
jgi:hypothetical protein